MTAKQYLKESVRLHREASKLANRARQAEFDGDEQAYQRLTIEAFEKEAASAELLRLDPSHHMHAILHRSAATLAYRSGKYREAETLAAYGLAANPTGNLRQELYFVLDRARLGSWIAYDSANYGADDLVVFLHGMSDGTGGVDYKLLPKIVETSALLLRNTIGFAHGYKFRDRAKVDEKIRISSNASANGVYRVGMKLARVAPRPLPGLDGFEHELSKLIDNIRLLAKDEIEQLRDRYKEERYFNNFVGLAKEVAPDGEQLTAVRWEANVEGQPQYAALDRARSELSQLSLSLQNDKPSSDYTLTDDWETVTGKLLYADATKDEDLVRLIPDVGKPWTIVVPQGLRDDVVRPYFGDRVRVTGRHLKRKQKRRRLHLHDISASTEPSAVQKATNTLV